jgi:hypothetical protein
MVCNTQNYRGFWILSVVGYSRNYKTFRKLDLFPSSGEWETHTLLGPLERFNLSHWAVGPTE